MHPQFTTKDAERFWSKVDAAGDCWLWTARCDRQGYGTFKWNGQWHFAHRIAYEMLVGPIPPNMTLDHLCRTHNCINPDHLQVTTLRENILRGYGLSAQRARRTHCPQGHPYDAGNTYTWRCMRQCRTCNRLRQQIRRQGQKPSR